MKVIFNYATRQFEPMEPSMRERFALGSKDPTPEVKTDGEVAGALMDAFPQQSFLQYQNAVDEGFQGTFEEFLQMNSLDKSELDMQAIEGQTAGAKALQGILKTVVEPEPFENLLRSSDELIQRFKKTKPVQESRDPNFSSIKLKKSRGTKLNQADIDKEKELTETFQTLDNNPVFDKIIPKKFKNIKSITELSQSDFAKIKKDITDFKFKDVTSGNPLYKMELQVYMYESYFQDNYDESFVRLRKEDGMIDIDLHNKPTDDQGHYLFYQPKRHQEEGLDLDEALQKIKLVYTEGGTI